MRNWGRYSQESRKNFTAYNGGNIIYQANKLYRHWRVTQIIAGNIFISDLRFIFMKYFRADDITRKSSIIACARYGKIIWFSALKCIEWNSQDYRQKSWGWFYDYMSNK